MKKILLVSGDSFTADNFVSSVHPELDTSWPMWPELLAKKLDMQLGNVESLVQVTNRFFHLYLIPYNIT